MGLEYKSAVKLQTAGGRIPRNAGSSAQRRGMTSPACKLVEEGID